MRWLDASPRRAAPKGHKTFISRAVMSSSHRPLLRRLLSAPTAQNAVKLNASTAARDRPVYLACRRCRAGPCGVSVEGLQYVELSHVLRVFFFHVVQRFHDIRLTSVDERPVATTHPLRKA